MIRRIPVEADRIRPKLTGLSGSLSGKSVSFLPLGFPPGEAKNRNRTLVPFTEPRCSHNVRADSIHPYSLGGEAGSIRPYRHGG